MVWYAILFMGNVYLLLASKLKLLNPSDLPLEDYEELEEYFGRNLHSNKLLPQLILSLN